MPAPSHGRQHGAYLPVGIGTHSPYRARPIAKILNTNIIWKDLDMIGGFTIKSVHETVIFLIRHYSEIFDDKPSCYGASPLHAILHKRIFHTKSVNGCLYHNDRVWSYDSGGRIILWNAWVRARHSPLATCHLPLATCLL